MEINALAYILAIHNYGAGGFWSIENPKKPASNSEIRRWMNNSVVSINGVAVKPTDWIDLETLESVILFPKNPKRKITLL